MSLRKTVLGRHLPAALVAALCVGSAWSQQANWPTQPIRMISCCAGIIDAISRVLGEQVAEAARQPVVVETKAGANGMLAADFVARSRPDGYTILVGTNSTHAANQSLFKKLPYDYVNDFVPITGIGQGVIMLVINPALPVQNVADLTALAKSKPGTLTFGWGSSSSRAASHLYRQLTGINIVDVPFKTNPQATTAVVGGQIDMMFADMATAVPLVKAGRLRALGVSWRARSSALPEAPSIAEAGVAGYDMTWWIAAWAPAGTPKEVVARLNDLLAQAIVTQKTKAYFQTIGVDGFVTSSDELMKFQVAEHDKWHKIISSAGIEPQ